MTVKVIVFDIDTDEVVQEFNSIKDTTKYLRELAEKINVSGNFTSGAILNKFKR